MTANDNNREVNAFHPTQYVEIAIEKGKERDIVACLRSSIIVRDQTATHFPNDQAEFNRLDLEHLIRALVDTFVISEVMTPHRAGNAALTSLLHNLSRYLALAIVDSGADPNSTFDTVADRLRIMTAQYIQEFIHDGQ